MTPRHDLSNHAVTIERGEKELSCMARYRYLTRTTVSMAIGLLLCMLPMLSIPEAIKNYSRRHVVADLAFTLILAIAPFLLGLLVLIVVLLRQRLPRGIVLRAGVVTLYTPDDTISRQVHELNNLTGAALVRSWSIGKVDVQISFRRGFAVKLFRGYAYTEIGHIVDLINGFIISDRSFAFEVIPLAKAVTQAQPIAPLPSQSSTPPVP